MKSTAFIFVLVEAAGVDSERKLRECLAARERPETKTNRNGRSAEDPDQLWTWFIDNPRPQSPK
jgi:hypothetical protein